MDRAAWVAERRSAVAAEYDALAPSYDDNPYPNDEQVAWVQRLLEMTEPGGVVLDAPCGTGRYFGTVVGSGRRVVGVDGSAGMLAMAAERGDAMELHHLALQDLTFERCFDAAMTIDAMENVAPDDWPTVLANMHRALRPGAPWYLTVEEQDDDAVAAASQRARERGLPVVPGEVVDGDVAGYHYYPSRSQVLAWFEAEGLRVLHEDHTQYDGWGYRHFVVT